MLKIDFNQAQKWYERLSVTNENIYVTLSHDISPAK